MRSRPVSASKRMPSASRRPLVRGERRLRAVRATKQRHARRPGAAHGQQGRRGAPGVPVADDVHAAGAPPRAARDRRRGVRAPRKHDGGAAQACEIEPQAARVGGDSHAHTAARLDRAVGRREHDAARDHLPELDGARVARHVARDHAQPVGAVGRCRAAAVLVGRPADGERPRAAGRRGPCARAARPAAPPARSRTSCSRPRTTTITRSARESQSGENTRRESPDARDAHGRVEHERVEQLDAATRELARAAGTTRRGRRLPAVVGPFQRATTRPSGCGETAQIPHHAAPWRDHLRTHRAGGVHAEAHLSAAHAGRGAARREERAVVAIENAAAVVRRWVDPDGLDRGAFELEHLRERECPRRGGEQSHRECDRDCALHRADRTRRDAPSRVVG